MPRLLTLAALAILAVTELVACSDNGEGGPSITTRSCETAGTVQVGAKPWAVGVDERRHRLYSADEFDNTITIVDLCSHAKITTLGSGIGPNSISVNRETGAAFVSNFNSNEVTIIQDDQVKRTVHVGEAPWAVLADEEAGLAYVANSQSGNISIVNPETDTPAGTIDGLAEPRGLALYGRTLLVAEANANRVRAFDLETKTFTGEAAVGQRPQGLAVDTAANELWVTNVDDATVSVISLKTMAVIETIAVGLSPVQVAVNSTRQRAYTADSFADTVTVIDSGGRRVLNAFTGVQRPWDVEASSASGYIYVANSATSEIIVFEAAALEAKG
jgi:YVTN family beta-propeller protein